jgi:hypothetical protein
MGNMVVVDGQLNSLLSFLLNGINGKYTLRLFVNNYQPTAADTVADYTEATFPGYAAQLIPLWEAPITNGGQASSYAPTVYFVLTGGGGPFNIYGYFVTDQNGNLAWAQRDPAAPVPVVNVGDAYPITPALLVESLWETS